MVITIRCSRLANLGQMLIEPRAVGGPELRLQPVVPLVDEVEDRLLAHERDRVRVGAAGPAAARDAAEQRGEDVLRIEPRRNRGPFGAAASKYSAFIGESLPCDFPVAQRTANSRLAVRLAGRQPGREDLVDGGRLRVVAGPRLNRPGQPADGAALVHLDAVLRLVAAGEVEAVDDEEPALHRLERHQDRRHRERRLAAGGRVLVADRAAANGSARLIHGHEPLQRHRRRLRAGAAPAAHDLQPGQRDGDGAGALDDRSTIELELHMVDCLLIPPAR